MPSTSFGIITTPSSADYLNPSITSMSPSTLLLGRVKEEELQRLFKDPSKYRNNSKGIVLFWINFMTILVSGPKIIIYPFFDIFS
jgi:hypothetical protein